MASLANVWGKTLVDSAVGRIRTWRMFRTWTSALDAHMGDFYPLVAVSWSARARRGDVGL
jgi:hypothetical protein